MIKVILVDDESKVRRGLEHFLMSEKLGVQITGSYSNAMDALDGMINEMPDILITDIKMPGINGIELIKRAKEMYPLLQCIILSGYDEFELAQAAMSEGVRHYLLKPYTKEKVERSIKECLIQLEEIRTSLIVDEGTRKILISKIISELLDLLAVNSEITVDDVKTIMNTYRDIGIVREVAISFVLKYCRENEREKIKAIISDILEDREQICQIIMRVLNALYTKKSSEETFVERIKKFIDENYSMPNLTLRFVAEEVVYMNTQYVGKQFIKQTGMKFNEYLLQVRIENAKKMLMEVQNDKMYKIAEGVGLGHDVQYFYLLFKKYTGLTPKEWQENNKNMGL